MPPPSGTHPLPRVVDLVQLHVDTVATWHREPITNPYDGFLERVCRQHEYNFRLWHEEDKARSPTASDHAIAEVKRTIDRLNQARNDAIEEVDDAIAETVTRLGVVADEASINTETAGSAIDRLSVMALRLYHYREQIERLNSDQQKMILQRVRLCERQHRDLSNSLQQLFDDILAGRKQHRTYRQLKMYNDPLLNPEIYDADRESDQGEL